MRGELSFGPGGWIRHNAGVYVRLVDDGDRLSIADVVMPFDQSPGIRALRQAAELAGRAESLANDPRNREIIRSKLDAVGPDPVSDLKSVRWPDPGRRHPPATYDELTAAGISVEDRGLRLERPSTRPYPDEFWQDVATVYQRAASRTSKPAVFIAEASDVPVNTVKTWVAETRKRGHLPEGRRGRAG